MVRKCKSGHWYDPNLFQQCPHCKKDSEKLKLSLSEEDEDDRTVSMMDLSLDTQLNGLKSADESRQGGADQKEVDLSTFDFGIISSESLGEDDDKTISLWDVLADDKQVSREKHCSITYDPKSNKFFVSGEHGNTIYLNGGMMEGIQEIRDGDILTVGMTELVFVPYCKEERTWEKV